MLDWYPWTVLLYYSRPVRMNKSQFYCDSNLDPDPNPRGKSARRQRQLLHRDGPCESALISVYSQKLRMINGQAVSLPKDKVK